jgi:pyrimidine operon attenuation protein/uracil phosphoribosyltransferase
MTARAERLLDAGGLAHLIDALARQIAEGRRPGVPLCLVGVRTRGVPIARRLAERLGPEVAVGAVEITLYRDDLDRRRSWPVLKGTEIAFPVDGAEVVLVDDVLSSGRTARAALNAICDLGRPDVVRLAVVADRGGRELPIRPDYVGRSFDVDPDDKLVVHVEPIDSEDAIVIQAPQGGGTRP